MRRNVPLADQHMWTYHKKKPTAAKSFNKKDIQEAFKLIQIRDSDGDDDENLPTAPTAKKTQAQKDKDNEQEEMVVPKENVGKEEIEREGNEDGVMKVSNRQLKKISKRKLGTIIWSNPYPSGPPDPDSLGK